MDEKQLVELVRELAEEVLRIAKILRNLQSDFQALEVKLYENHTREKGGD